MSNRMLESRRNFLRGAGVALALPWLESLPTMAADTKSQKPPIRLATIYFSNGVEPAHWWARGSGASMEFGQAARPLAPIASDIIFLRGLYHYNGLVSSSPHLGRMNLLSGETVSLDPKEIRVGTSFDQVLAQRIGDRTAIPSLALGIEPNELRLEDGVSMIYGSAISWVTPTKPAPKEIYPARAFDMLVGDGDGRRVDRHILDAVLGDVRNLRRRVSAGDRIKLDEYLESIDDIEKRIARATREERFEGWRPTLTRADMARPADQLPRNVPEHIRLMLDLIVLAFRMDRTRIVTLMLNNDLSQMNFRFLEGVRGALHLDLTHNGKVPEAEAMYLKTNQFHVAQFTYLVERLKQIDEGGSSLLDNSMLLLASSLFDGDAHGADQLPFVLAGRAGGAIRTGRIIDLLDRDNDNRRACSLFLSMMDAMGVRLDRFGDSDRRVEI